MGKIGLVCLWFLFAVMIVILVITFIWGIRHAYISTKKAIEEYRLNAALNILQEGLQMLK